MRSLHKISVASFTISSLCVASPAFAQDLENSISGQVEARLELTSGCVVQNGSADTQTGDFGILDFGAHPGTFQGTLTAAVQGQSSADAVELVCTDDQTAVAITIDGGANSAQASTAKGTGTRALADGSQYIAYEVYGDSTHDTPYEIGQPQAFELDPAASTFAVPIYGKIVKPESDAWPTGLYTDTLHVEIAW